MTGIYNTFLGSSAGQSNTSGSNNVFLGRRAGYNCDTGSSNIFIGTTAGYGEKGANRLYIDNFSGANPLIYGEFDNNILTVNGRLGVGTTSPAQGLEVLDDANIGGGSSADGGSEFLRISGKSDNWFLGVENEVDSIYADFYIGKVAGDGIFHIENGGNIGIGTTDPAYKLEVISSLTAVRGRSLSGTAVNPSTGVYGSAYNDEGDSRGVYGFADGENGLVCGVRGYSASGGAASYGVYGVTGEGSGMGVYGKNDDNGNYGYLGGATSGAYGRHNSSGHVGQLGTASSGVSGSSSTGKGVYGYSADGSGVHGYSINGLGVEGITDNGRGAYFRNSNNSYYAAEVINATGTGATVKGLYVQGHGYATGGFTTYLGNGKVAHAIMSEDVEIISSGTSKLMGGQAIVEFDDAFTSAISPEVPVNITLTPVGMPAGMLFLDEVSDDGFTVKLAEIADLESGITDVQFNWMAIGRRIGYEETPDIEAPNQM
jgi:hypothetical protein